MDKKSSPRQKVPEPTPYRWKNRSRPLRGLQRNLFFPIICKGWLLFRNFLQGHFITMAIVLNRYENKVKNFCPNYSVQYTTIYGGNFLHTQLTGYYYQGLYMLILSLGSPLRFYLASRFIIVRMKEWLGDYSIAESEVFTKPYASS